MGNIQSEEIVFQPDTMGGCTQRAYEIIKSYGDDYMKSFYILQSLGYKLNIIKLVFFVDFDIKIEGDKLKKSEIMRMEINKMEKIHRQSIRQSKNINREFYKRVNIINVDNAVINDFGMNYYNYMKVNNLIDYEHDIYELESFIYNQNQILLNNLS